MLQTKLHRPPITREHVYRNHLIDFLDKNLYKPLTLVSAGAGYGKSTLISSWLEKSKVPYSWVSLNDDDNDLRTFIDFIFASIKKTFPKSLGQLNDSLKAAVLPPLNVISEILINGLDEIDKEFVLVLDDFHLIQNNQINQLIGKLLSFPPQNMQLVIISRNDPFLNLNSLRAYSRMNEIRMAELCFTENEIIKLFMNLLNVEIKTDIAHKLMQKTEGWITALRITSLIVKKDEDVNEAIKKIDSISPITSVFLINQVVLSQPELIQKFIFKMSILDKFCDEMLDDFFHFDSDDSTERKTGKDVIHTLLNANLFTISLDNDGKWYRFHHLFQEILQNQLKNQHSIEDINAYHIEASEWFDKNGFIEAALKHALIADKIPVIVSIIEKFRNELINNEQWNRIDHILKLIPINIIEINPILLCTKAWHLEYRGQLLEAFECMDKAKLLLEKTSLISSKRDEIEGEIAVMKSQNFLVFGNSKKAFEFAMSGLKLVPVHSSLIRSYAITFLVVLYQMEFELKKGLKIVEKLVKENPLFPSSKARILFGYSVAYWLECKIHKARPSALLCFELGQKHKVQDAKIFGGFILGAIHYANNELSEAEKYLQNIVSDPYSCRPLFLVNSGFILALINFYRGQNNEANKIIDKLILHISKSNDILSLNLLRSFKVELSIKNGDVSKAKLLNRDISYDQIPHLWFYYLPHLTNIKLLLAENTTESLEKAVVLITQIDEYFKKINKISGRIQLLALHALILNRQGKNDAAIAKLTESISFVNPEESVRVYIDLGSGMKKLLSKLPDNSKINLQVKSILNAFPHSEIKSIQLPKDPSLKKMEYNTLSFREIEVLKLVSNGLRNKEIAEKLFVSTNTIKKHLYNTSQKLLVNKRFEMVNKAKRLGILDEKQE